MAQASTLYWAWIWIGMIRITQANTFAGYWTTTWTTKPWKLSRTTWVWWVRLPVRTLTTLRKWSTITWRGLRFHFPIRSIFSGASKEWVPGNKLAELIHLFLLSLHYNRVDSSWSSLFVWRCVAVRSRSCGDPINRRGSLWRAGHYGTHPRKNLYERHGVRRIHWFRHEKLCWMPTLLECFFIKLSQCFKYKLSWES